MRAAAGGVLGALTSEAVRLGVMRGLLSNEAGCGTSPTAHAYSVTASPSEQGAMGVIEVFVDTILLCTLTALVILVSGEPSEGGDLMTVTMRAFSRILGPWAGGAVSLSVIFFGGATAVCWTHYGRSGVTYLSDKKWLRVVFGVTYTLCAFLGGVIPSGGSFAAVDISLGIMTVINIITLLLCRREIVEGTEVFRRVKKRSG